jgi:hypothetical protein
VLEAAELRAAAARLRSDVDAIADLLRTTAAHDRDDVWRGGRADELRAEWREVEGRLLSPWFGAATRLLEAADRFERRAAVIEATVVPPFVAR